MSMNSRYSLLSLFLILMFVSLACGFGLRLPEPPEQVESLVTAQAAILQSGDAIQTAAAMAPEQGATAVAALQAMEAPQLDQIRSKFSGIQPDQFGNYTVTLTETEVNELLQTSQILSTTGGQVQLENPTVAFRDSSVNLNARMVEPVGANIQLTLLPQVTDGTIRFQLKQASVGPLPAPQFILTTVNSALNAALENALADVPETLKLTSISIGEGTITVVGRPA